jgi:uncharacterized protein YdaU (DUF1376 family)
MSKLPYFPFYPSDFIADTQLLTDKEVGAYFRLLLIQWINGAIPAKKVPLLIEDHDIIWPEIKQYFIVKHGKVSNKRLERERVKAIALIDVRSEAGKAGAKARWDGKGNAVANGKSNGKHDGKTMLTQSLELNNNNISNFVSSALSSKGLIYQRIDIPSKIEKVYSQYGEKATLYIINKICGFSKASQQQQPNYVQKVIQGDIPILLQIKSGKFDENGEAVKIDLPRIKR